jgi:ribonucleoside-diphosphate reductase alpha chain
MQAGGGVGCDFSPLRPAGTSAVESGNVASGPVSFLHVWDKACETLVAGSSRRGAMMATLRCDHPDIEHFINAKRKPGALRHFNLSVLVTDAFMRAVEEDAPWPLMFPLTGRAVPPGARISERVWSGSAMPQTCLVTRTIGARSLWKELQAAAFACGDPGVLFIDRVERDNNLYYAETISATNPCGEVPLPPHGACNLGSINLTQFVDAPFGRHPKLDLAGIAGTAAVATRMLDNVYEVSHFPLKAQQKVALASRRIGLGITGLADAFAMLGVRYGSSASLEIADKVMATVCHAAYRTSIDLAHERGAFPAYRPEQYLGASFIRSLPPDIFDAIAHKGIHNSHLTAIAPAGSISLLANNVASGIEPIYAFHGHRSVRAADGTVTRVPVRDYAWALFRKLRGDKAALPDYFVEAHDVDPLDQLKLQAALQAHVDQSISKTINVPAQADEGRYLDVFTQAYQAGVKGCTMFRPSPDKAGVLGPAGAPGAAGGMP